MQRQQDSHTDNAQNRKNTGAVILSINRVITLWQEDIAESKFYINHHRVNVQALEKHINSISVRLGSSGLFVKQSATVMAKISKHRAEIDKHTDFISQTEQDIINMTQVVNVFKHSPKAPRNANKKRNKSVSTVESIDRAIDMLNKRIVDANDAQISAYLSSQKNGSEFTGTNDVVIDIYKQDIENLTSLCCDSHEMNQYDFYQKIR